MGISTPSQDSNSASLGPGVMDEAQLERLFGTVIEGIQEGATFKDMRVAGDTGVQGRQTDVMSHMSTEHPDVIGFASVIFRAILRMSPAFYDYRRWQNG